MDYFLTSINSPTPLPPTILSVSSFTEKRKESERTFQAPPITSTHLPVQALCLCIPSYYYELFIPLSKANSGLVQQISSSLAQSKTSSSNILSPELSFFPLLLGSFPPADIFPIIKKKQKNTSFDLISLFRYCPHISSILQSKTYPKCGLHFLSPIFLLPFSFTSATLLTVLVNFKVAKFSCHSSLILFVQQHLTQVIISSSLKYFLHLASRMHLLCRLPLLAFFLLLSFSSPPTSLSAPSHPLDFSSPRVLNLCVPPRLSTYIPLLYPFSLTCGNFIQFHN